MGVSSPFSSDLISGTKFEFIKKPKSKDDKKDEENKLKKKSKNEVDFGTYTDKGGETITYRVRNPGVYGTYKIVTEKVGGDAKTRNDLLEERCKKKADRLCM